MSETLTVDFVGASGKGGGVVRTFVVVSVGALVAAFVFAGTSAPATRPGGTVVVAWEGAGAATCLRRPTACAKSMSNEEYQLTLAASLRARPDGWGAGLVRRYTLTRDPFTVTLHLRRDARWSDGTPLTAADYVYTWNLLKKEPWYALRTARRVSAVDKNTVRVEFPEPDGLWRIHVAVSLPLPRHVWGGLSVEEIFAATGRGIVDPRSGKPIASGPFLMQSFRPGREAVFSRNPRYWAPAKLDRLVMRFGQNTAEALRNGEVDVVGGSGRDLSAALPFAERPEKGIKVVAGPSNSLEYLSVRVDGGHPALRNKLVRRALAYGIDRVAIVRALYGKIAPTTRVADNVAFTVGERGYRPNWAKYRYRPAETRRLLTQAGCRRGSDGIFTCAGQRLSLRFVTQAGVEYRQRTLELVKAQLRPAGVEVIPLYTPDLTRVRPGDLVGIDYDVLLAGLPDQVPDGLTGFEYARCREPGNPFNPSGYCSRLFNADIDQLRKIVEPTRLAAVANRADRRLAADVPLIPLYRPPRIYAYRESISGLRPNPFWPIWWNAETWSVER